ncbi:MAG: hypothetical protein VB085_06390 [Peptococcaceae bacterium]|nr:hypothetical protein [Peptococcaceae bacterium]
MEKIKLLLDKINWGYIIAGSFVINILANWILFYFGLLGSEKNHIRSIIFVVISLLYFFIVGVKGIECFIENKNKRKEILLSSVLPFFFIACFIIAISRYGLKGLVYEQLKLFGIYGLSAYASGILTAVYYKEDVLEKFEKINLIMLFPGIFTFFYYIITGSRNLGVMNYMNIAYSFLPFLFAELINYVRETPLLELKLKKKVNIYRLLVISLYWVIIIGSGTRGAIFSTLGFIILLLMYTLWAKKHIKNSLISCCIIVIIFFISMTGTKLPGAERMHAYLKNLSTGEISTSNEQKEVYENLKKEIIDKSAEKKIKDNSDEEEVVIEKPKDVSGIKDRKTLYKLAFLEARSNLWGLGPMGFLKKYGMYPHNIIFELFSDLGFLVGGSGLVIIFSLIIKLLIYCRQDEKMGYMFVFILGNAIPTLFSGCLWSCSILMFAVSYAFLYKRQIKLASD